MPPSSRLPRLTAANVAALLLVFAPFVYFLPAVIGSLVLCESDCLVTLLPLRVAAAREVLAGRLPLWNPYSFDGMPLLGAAQAGVLFPLNWTILALPTPTAMTLTALATYALAGLGAFLYARRGGADLAGALATGLVWQWGGFLVAQISHTNIVQTASLLPRVLWAIDGYGMTARRGWGVAIAALVALQCCAGNQQTLAYSLLLAGLYAAAMAAAHRPLRRSYLVCLPLIAAGVALGAVQILPTLELLRYSVRADATYDFVTSFSFPGAFLPTLLAPYLWGGGDGGLFRAPYVGPDFYAEYAGYVGVTALTLAVAAPLLRRDARTTFWTAAALVALALALGRYLPVDLYRAIEHVPVLGLFRAPARHLMEVDLALAVLAGRTLSALPTLRQRAVASRALLGTSMLLLLLALASVTLMRPAEFRLARQGPVSFLRAPELFVPPLLAALSVWLLWRVARGRPYARVTLLAFIAFDLALWGQASGWRLGPSTANVALWQEPASYRLVRAQAGAEGTYRFLSLPPARGSGSPSSVSLSDPTESFLASQPGVGMWYGLQNAAGYDGFGLARFSRLAGDMKVWGELSVPERTLVSGRELDVLNVRYLLAIQPSPEPPAENLAATQVLGGQRFAPRDLEHASLPAGARLDFVVPAATVSSVALMTTLSFSENVANGEEVARLRLDTAGGPPIDFPLLAGVHTAEWAHDRPSLVARIRHDRAPVAQSWKVDEEGGYQGHTYVAVVHLPRPATITGGEIQVATPPGAPTLDVRLLRMSLIDDAAGTLVPLRSEWLDRQPSTATLLDAPDAGRWRQIGRVGDVTVFENTRALPRVWLATEALSMNDEDVLKVVRSGYLPDGTAWDPLRTVLLDGPSPIALQGSAGASRAEIVRYVSDRIEVRTASDVPSILVLSENFYPGWVASIDGEPASPLRVIYNLRGLALPPGEHLVTWEYRPRSVLIGALVSAATAVILLVWWLLSARHGSEANVAAPSARKA